jgi:putative transposase
MVEKPEEYPWSSYSFNGLGKADALIVPHVLYSSMSNESLLRCHLYRELFKVNLSVDDVHIIRTCLDASQVLGRGRFKEQIEAAIDCQLGYIKRGRPKRVVG